MSYQLINAAWSASELSVAEKCVLVRLADRADHECKCFPGHQSIAADCGLSERSVRRILPALESKGHLTINREANRGGKGKSLFSFKVHPVTPDNVSTVTPDKSAHDAGHPDNRHRTNGVATPDNVSAPYNRINPKTNHQGESGTTPPRFEPVKRGLYRREYDEMEAHAKTQINSIKKEPRNYAKDLSRSALEVIGFIKGKAEPGWEARIEDVLNNPNNYERTNLKPHCALTLEAWKARLVEIQRVREGVI